MLAGGGITGFLYEVGVLTALDELAGRALSNDFDVYVGTSAGAVLAALLANGAHAAEIFAAMTQNEAGSPFYFESRDILGVGSGGPLRMMGQFARATFGTLGRALRAKQRPSFAQMFADFQEHHPPGFYSTEAREDAVRPIFSAWVQPPVRQALAGTLCYRDGHRYRRASGFRRGRVRRFAHLPRGRRFMRNPRVLPSDPHRRSRRCRRRVSEVCPLEIAVERGATAIVFVNPMVPIRNDRARICIPAPGGHCARLSEKGVGWIGEQAMRLMRAHSLGSAIDTLRSNPRVQLLHVEPGPDEMQLFMHSIMSFSTGRELLEYGRDSGRRFFASSGAAILSTGDSCASAPDHSLTACHARAAV